MIDKERGRVYNVSIVDKVHKSKGVLMRSKNSTLMEKILEYINNEYCQTETMPTIREIASALNVSKSCVGKYITEMKNNGVILNNGDWRGIRTKAVNKIQHNIQYLPVVGSIACGQPILAEENIETYLPIPQEFLGNGKFFILKAEGESMVNAGINSGDYVIVRQQETAEEGQIVVALIENEATLKRYYLDKLRKQIRLHPDNDNMSDMYFDNIVIQGVAIKVIKDL